MSNRVNTTISQQECIAQNDSGVDKPYLEQNASITQRLCGRAMREAYHIDVRILVALLLHPDLGLNALADRILARALTDLRQVGATEALRDLGKILQVNILKRTEGHADKA